MTAIDTAHAAMEAAPEDDAARLRFWGAVTGAELFLLLAEEEQDGRITPAEVVICTFWTSAASALAPVHSSRPNVAAVCRKCRFSFSMVFSV